MTEIKYETLKTESQNLINQNLKILYLQDEVKQLHEKIFDLEEMLKLNKDALKISLNLTSSSPPTCKKLANSNSTQDKSNEESNSEKSFKGIISHMDQENSRLLKSIDKLTKERNAAQSKALINEQIADEAQKHEADVTAEFECKMAEMLRMINEKEKRLQELEKIKPIMDRDGLVVQYREILSPSEQIIRLHNELENTKTMLIKISKEVGKLQGEKKELLTINFNLVNELNKLRVSMISPLNSLKQTETPQDLNQSALALLNFHKKFLEDSDSGSDHLSPMNSPFPEKVQRNPKKERSDTTPDLKSKNNMMKKGPPGIKIPKLDLTQAKKIQEINAKKSTQQAQPKVDNKVFERFHNMENEMEKTKKMLQKEMGENKIFIEENEILLKNNKELMSMNDTLKRSQKQYEEKWRKLFHALQFYKDFYHKYLELILNNVSNKSQDFQSLEIYRQQNSNFENLLKDPERLINEKRRKEEEGGKMVNVSILDLNDEHIKEENKLEQILQTAEKDDFKIYLLNLAKDLSLLMKKPLNCPDKINEKPENIEKPNLPSVRMKKSLSNPIDYRTEIKRLLLENFNKNLPIGKDSSSNKKNLNKTTLNVNIPPIKSPAFGNKKGCEKEVDELGLESPEQIIYHTNYEEEDIIEDVGIKE